MEVDHHADLLEVRFDHMAMGGTIIMIIILLCVVWRCGCKKKRRGLEMQFANPGPQAGSWTNPFGRTAHQAGMQIPIVWHVNTDEIGTIASTLAGSTRAQPMRRWSGMQEMARFDQIDLPRREIRETGHQGMTTTMEKRREPATETPLNI